MSVPQYSDVELGDIGHVTRAHEDIMNRDEDKLSLFTRKEDYERSLQGLRKISLTTYTLDSVNVFVAFCALTWASTVLLGSYVQTLHPVDYFEVPIMLFLQYVCIGLFAFHRTVGYRPHKGRRNSTTIFSVDFLLLLELNIPFFMGGFALQCYSIQKRDSRISSIAPTTVEAPQDVSDPHRQQRALEFFYVLIILNASIVLAKVSIKSILHSYFLRSSSATSLLHYYNQIQHQGKNSLPQPWLDLESAFKMQSFDYKSGSSPKEVCGLYTDLIWYLYGHDAGFEAAEAAMADTDSYVRQAAANMVGFWAVLESLLDLRTGYTRLPLQFQHGLLSKLADMAVQSYGPTGTAAARSIAALLEADPVGMATKVRLQSGEGLVAILVKRVNQLLPIIPPSSSGAGARNLQEEVRSHIHVLRKLLLQLHVAAPPSSSSTPIFTEAQREQILAEMKRGLVLQEERPATSSLSERLDELCSLLPPSPFQDGDYFSEIESLLRAPGPPRCCSISVLFKPACFFIGFFLAAVLRRAGS